MKTAETIVVNESGLHARPAVLFTRSAAQFTSDIRIRNMTTGSQEVNAKSTMRVLTLAMVKGTCIRLTAEGADEDEAIQTLIALIDSGLRE